MVRTWLDFTDLVFIDPIDWVQSQPGVVADESKKLFYGPTRILLTFADRLRLAGEERPPGVAQVHRRRELRRVSRTATDQLPAVADRGGDQWVGAGVSGTGTEWRVGGSVAVLDADAAFGITVACGGEFCSDRGS